MAESKPNDAKEADEKPSDEEPSDEEINRLMQLSNEYRLNVQRAKKKAQKEAEGAADAMS